MCATDKRLNKKNKQNKNSNAIKVFKSVRMIIHQSFKFFILNQYEMNILQRKQRIIIFVLICNKVKTPSFNTETNLKFSFSPYKVTFRWHLRAPLFFLQNTGFFLK